MKKTLVALIAFLLVAGTLACSASASEPSVAANPVITPTPGPAKTHTQPTLDEVLRLGIKPVPITTEWETTHMNNPWVNPSEVFFNNLFPGYVGPNNKYTINLHNGEAIATVFKIFVREADYLKFSDTEPLPAEYFNWITINDAAPIVPAYTTIATTIEVNLNRDVGEKKYETWLIYQPPPRTDLRGLPTLSEMAVRIVIRTGSPG